MEEAKDQNPLRKEPSAFWDIVRFTLLALIIVIPIRTYVAQPFIVSGDSMDPTFATGEYLIIDELSYRFHEPERGDVIIFRFPLDPSKFFIKRIIGLPKETVEIKNGTIAIKETPDGTKLPLPAPYLETLRHDNVGETLTDDEYFVMGDNRVASSDSRNWGPVPRNLIVGRALLRLLPIARAEVLPGSISHSLPALGEAASSTQASQ
jgi:signal peptidase I